MSLKVGFLCLLLSISGSLCTGVVQDFDAGSASDSDVVHGLAHQCAGVYVALPAQIFVCAEFPKTAWERQWWALLGVDVALAVAVTDAYESETDKSGTVRLQHDLDGAIGGAEVSLVYWSASW